MVALNCKNSTLSCRMSINKRQKNFQHNFEEKNSTKQPKSNINPISGNKTTLERERGENTRIEQREKEWNAIKI